MPSFDDLLRDAITLRLGARGITVRFVQCAQTRYCRGLPEFPSRVVTVFPASTRLCYNRIPARPNPDVFPYAPSEPWGVIRCPNPRPEGSYICPPCAATLRRAARERRRDAEAAGACTHGPGCWPSLEEMIERDGGRCRYCGTAVTRGLGLDGACRDHVIPVSRGGAHCAENAALACRRCNNEKSDLLPAEFGGSPC